MTNVDEIKNRTRGAIMDQIDRRTTDLGNTVGEHGANLRTMSQSLSDQGQTATANLVKLAADRLDGLSTYLTQTDGDGIVSDLESAARRQPLSTAAVGLVGGLLMARLLKASARKRYRSETSGYGSARNEQSSGQFVR